MKHRKGAEYTISGCSSSVSLLHVFKFLCKMIGCEAHEGGGVNHKWLFVFCVSSSRIKFLCKLIGCEAHEGGGVNHKWLFVFCLFFTYLNFGAS